MKKTVFILILISLVSCSNKNELEGFWYSNTQDNLYFVKFENKFFIDYFFKTDTTEYNSFGNKLYFIDSFGDEQAIKYEVKDNKLLFYNSKDSLMNTLKRNESKNYFFDFLSDKTLNIQLPKGNGTIKKHRRYYDNNFPPLYLTSVNNTLVSNFGGLTRVVDNDYYKFLFTEIKENPSYEIGYNRIPLIADKDVRMSDIILIEKQLRITGYDFIYYLMDIDTYDEVNSFSMHMRPISEKELRKYDADFYKEEAFIPFNPKFDYYDSKLLEIDKSKIVFDNEISDLTELKKIIRTNLISNSDFNVFYYITNDSTYQDYINVFESVYNTIVELRNEYLMEKYGVEYPIPRNYLIKQSDIDKERMDEVKNKYPFRFIRMDFEEYKNVKEKLIIN